MKVLFVFPAVGNRSGSGYVESWKMEPLTFAVLAGITPNDVECVLVDDRIEPVDYDAVVDLVAMTVETYTARRAYTIAEEFRKRGVPVVLGGHHPTLIPDEAEQYADAVMIGEADSIWCELLSDAKAGRLKKRYQAVTRPQLTGIKPDRSVYGSKKYLPLSLVETSRGCNGNCTFCSISAFYHQTHSFRPAREVAEEIASLGSRRVFLVDDNIIATPHYAKELFRALIPLKIRWISQCSIAAAKDREMLDLMRKSGCAGVLIGFESLEKGNLVLMNKGWNDKDIPYGEALDIIRDYGIGIYATFVFGYDHDTHDGIKRTVDFAIRQKFLLAAFNHLVPFPGTPLYDRLHHENRLLHDKWWLHPTYQYGDIAFRHPRFSPQELSDLCLDARRAFFSMQSIARRALDLKVNCRSPFMASMYLWANLLLRKEVTEKRALVVGK